MPEVQPEEETPALDSTETPVPAEEQEPEDDGRRKRQWSQARVEAALEALLFASPDVLGFRNMRKILPEQAVSNEAIRAALGQLKERYERKESGIILIEISGGWQIQTREDFFPWVQELARTRTDEKITAAALETLAIIAYKQPITRAEIDAIRGVGSGQIIRTLMDKKMVKVVGRVELPGRPFQYGTTPHFLSHFGLKNLKDLPRGKDL
ncbi:MAG: segregation and condensation protein B [Planctomycetota bacterium]|jgi:segregation and condensation protein B